MKCSVYRTEPAALIAALTEPASLAKYQQRLAAEIPSCIERGLITHLRQLCTLASGAQAEGFDRVAERDAAAADALLSDLFAVATYDGWPLPVEAMGESDLPLDGLPRGILAADRSAEGARVYLIDDQTIAIARNREVSDSAVG